MTRSCTETGCRRKSRISLRNEIVLGENGKRGEVLKICTTSKRLTKYIRRTIRTYKNNLFNERIKNLKADNNTLWRVTKRYKQNREPIPALMGSGVVAHTIGEKADLLAITFQRVRDISNGPHNREHLEVVRVVEDFLAANIPQINEHEKISLVTSPQ